MKRIGKSSGRFLPLMLVLILLAGAFAPANIQMQAAEQESNTRLNISYTFQDGELRVYFFGENLEKMASLLQTLTYDRTKLEYTGAEWGGEFDSSVKSVKEKDGKITMAVADAVGVRISNGSNFLTLKFRPLFDGEEFLELGYDVQEYVNSELENVEVNYSSQAVCFIENSLASYYQISVQSNNWYVSPNSKCEMGFGFSSNAGVMAGSMELAYDEEKMQFDSVTPAEGVEGLVVSYTHVDTGRIKIAYAFSSLYTEKRSFLRVNVIPIEKNSNMYVGFSHVEVTNADLMEVKLTKGENSYGAGLTTTESEGGNLFLIDCPHRIDANEEFDVTVKLNGNTGFAALTASLNYDSELLELMNYSMEEGILGSAMTSVSTTAQGKVKIAAVSSSNVTESGNLIKLHFKVIQNVNAPAGFELDVKEMKDSAFADIDYTKSNAKVIIGKSELEATPEATATATPEVTPEVTATPEITATPTATSEVTAMPTATSKVTATPTVTPTVTQGTNNPPSSTADANGQTKPNTMTVRAKIKGVGDILLGSSCKLAKKKSYKKIYARFSVRDETYTVTSSNPKVVKVSNGKITGLKTGNANLIVQSSGGLRKTIKVTVVKNAIKKMKLKLSKTLKVKKKLKAKVTVTPKKKVSKNFVWKTSKAKVAAVTSKGVVKGLKKGKVKITVYATDGSGKKVSVKLKVK